MRTTLSWNFYCRASKATRNGLSPVELSVCTGGTRLFLAMPFKCDAKDFNRKRRPKPIQDYINAMTGRITTILADMAREGIPVTANNLREYIRTGGYKSYTVEQMFDDYLTLQRPRVGKDLTQGAYRKYELVRDLFLNFHKGTEITSITNEVIQSFYIYLQGKYNSTTVASYMAKLRTFIINAINNGKLKYNPFNNFHVKRVKKPIDYLTEEEISIIKNTDLNNKSLEDVRDAFLLQVYSGLSYIDLEHLHKEDIHINEEGVHYISKNRVKTNAPYTSIILPEGVEILKAHNYQLRVISNQKMNTYLKSIMTLCNLDHRLTTHLGRKTYGHILLNKYGCRMEVVSKCLGHLQVKTTASYYAELTKESIINEVSKVLR